MKLLTWNICHGGSKRRLPMIAAHLIEQAVDVVVLTEFRPSKGFGLLNRLRESGYTLQYATDPPAGGNGLLMAARVGAHRIDETVLLSGAIPQRRLSVQIRHPLPVTLLAVHVPGADDSWGIQGKEAFWRALISWAHEHVGERAVILGDLNTGLDADAEGTPFRCGELMRELLDLGWVDAWRRLHGPEARDFTWWSRTQTGGRNGFRLDYAFISPALAPSLQRAEHVHQVREDGASDHSMLVVELVDCDGKEGR